MANAKCRSCDHAADAGAYCSSCAADIMPTLSTPSPGKPPGLRRVWRGLTPIRAAAWSSVMCSARKARTFSVP